MEDRPSIDKLIAVWKADCGITKQSDMGTTYVVVPIPDRYTNFLNLIQTLLDHGYKDELESSTLSTKVVLACWPDIIKKMGAKELRKSRDITRHQWQEAVNKFSDIKISKYEEPEKEIPVWAKRESIPEKLIEIDPKDRIKMDTSDIPNPELDLEFLKELGADE